MSFRAAPFLRCFRDKLVNVVNSAAASICLGVRWQFARKFEKVGL